VRTFPAARRSSRAVENPRDPRDRAIRRQKLKVFLHDPLTVSGTPDASTASGRSKHTRGAVCELSRKA